MVCIVKSFFLKKIYIFGGRERGREGGREREKREERGRSGELPGIVVTFVVSALRKLKQEN